MGKMKSGILSTEKGLSWDVCATEMEPHVVRRKTRCLCGKMLVKGTSAFFAVFDFEGMYESGDEYWAEGRKIVCSTRCWNRNVAGEDDPPEDLYQMEGD